MRPLLRLWLDGYARRLSEPDGPWAGFGLATVRDWLALLADFQPPAERDTAAGLAERSLLLAVLRGTQGRLGTSPSWRNDLTRSLYPLGKSGRTTGQPR